VAPTGKRLRWSIFQRDGHKCTCCGKTAREGAKLEVDHIIPVSKGGTNNPKNLRTLCQDCNRGKAARTDPLQVIGPRTTKKKEAA
jgi:5-methylcytosine-specific restriction endonuclease McrA